MAAQSDNVQTESAGASDTIWPPPPTYTPVELAPQRRLLLPLYMALPQMPKRFGLPKWASSASLNLWLAFTILWLAHDAPVVSKRLVGIFVLGHSVEFLSLLTWAFFISLHGEIGSSWVESWRS